ncbi:hypothetical protein FQN55_004491 [Onygenales sp. PD_40]|nr:hypothetical protein FQN55_004491 [Onygenales sp. PD_40]
MGLQVLAAPAPSDPMITPAPRRPLVVREDGRADFGTEIITVTYHSDDIRTVTLHNGIELGNTGDSGQDEAISFANDEIVGFVWSIANNTDSTAAQASGNPPARRDHSEVVGFEKRAPPVLENLNLGDCTSERVRSLLEQMNQPDSIANQLIPIAEEAAGVPELQELADHEFERLVAFAEHQALLVGLHNARRIRATVSLSLLMIRAFELGLDIGRELVVLARNFDSNPDKTRMCGIDEDAPACPDVNCQGDAETLKCTVDPNKDCDCYRVGEIGPGWPFDAEALDQQQELLLPYAPLPDFPNNPPKCNGLGTTEYADPEAAVEAMNDFCGSAALVGGPNKPGLSKEYYANGENWLELKIDWKAGFTMGSDECFVLFKTIADGCDGNEPLFNRYNYKHGGSIKHPKGAILTFTPKAGGGNPACEPTPYDGKNWIDRDAAEVAISQFCYNHDLNQVKGERAEADLTSGNSYQVTVGALWTRDVGVDPEDCIDKLLHVAVDGCAGNNPFNNPTNKKYFSTLFNTDDGIMYAIAPRNQPDEYPPDEINHSGDVIEVECDGEASPSPDAGMLQKAMDEYCIDGNNYGKGLWVQPASILSLKLTISTSEADGQATYQQGDSVCRHNQDFSGKINAADCRETIARMTEKCWADFPHGKGPRTSDYNYNCVHYTVLSSYCSGLACDS